MALQGYRILQGLLIGFILVGGGCLSSLPPPKLPHYLGTPLPIQKQPVTLKEPLHADLLVLNDTSGKYSPPPLSKDTMDALTKSLRTNLGRTISIVIEEVLPAQEFASGNVLPSLQAFARRQGKRYLMLAVFSSVEVEAPDRLPLQGILAGGSGLVGYRVENYALAELALLDVRTGQILVQADGRAWAVLKRLAVPLASNVYPVVRRNWTFPPIYPDSDEVAYEVLRQVASQDALEQALFHLKERWNRLFAASHSDT
ncbi:MAG: hypothetical protein D6704_03455 [Nitrospirae bacterium]|nr:MAG: hypothetical protein D6704_03455 [Nitrospirota bacterium]